MSQQIYLLSDEGIKVLAELITKNIKNELQLTSNATKEDEFLNINSLSELIGLTKATIYGHVHRKTIPFIKKGRMLKFSKLDILSWLQDGKSQSASTLEAKVNDYLAKNPLINR